MKNATTGLTGNRNDRQNPPNSRLTIQHRPVDTLRLDPRNPREHSKKQIAQVAESIRAFGFNVPVLIDDDNKIIAGHGRVLACQLLGISEVPTICLSHLSPEQVRAFIIADNKLTENATWNEILLGEQLKSLSEIDLNFSLEATGFEMGEIDVLIEGISQPGARAQDDPADVLPDQSEILVSAPGDWWQLGKHRVLCGNALEPASYDRLMSQQLAAVVFTDPRYNVPVDGHASQLGKKQHRDFTMACGEMSRAEFTDFLRTMCKRLVSASRDGAIHFICMDWRHIGELLDASKDVYDEVKNMCVWVKENAGKGSLYRSQHQLILVFKQGKQSHRNNVQLREFGRCRSDVWQYPGANSFSRATGTTPAWARFTAVSTNLFSYSSRASNHTATMCSWGNSVVPGAMSGSTRARIHFPAQPPKGTCSTSTLQASLSPSSQMPSWTARRGATSFWILF